MYCSLPDLSNYVQMSMKVKIGTRLLQSHVRGHSHSLSQMHQLKIGQYWLYDDNCNSSTVVYGGDIAKKKKKKNHCRMITMKHNILILSLFFSPRWK